MKIAFIGQKGIPAKTGGIERYTENLAINLAGEGHEVLLYSRYYYSQGIKQYKGVRIISVPSLKSKNLEAITNTFFACLDLAFRKVDIINFQAIGPASLIWLIKILKPGTPVVFTFHCQDYYHQKWGGFARWYLKLGEKIGCRFADKVIVTSRVLQDYVKNTYQLAAEYIPYGAATPEKIEVSSIRRWGLEKNNYIVSIGRLVRHKGVHYLIEAFKQTTTDKKLVIVGEAAHTADYAAELMALAKNDERIIFTGNQTGRDLKELFSNAYLFVQPSEYEGLSVALLEAMGFGLACLVSNISQNEEAVATNGLTFENKNVNDLKEKLNFLINNPNETERFGRAALARVKQEYNWPKVTAAITSCFAETIKNDKFTKDKFSNTKIVPLKVN